MIHMRAHRSTHMRSQEREAHFVRASAVEIHMAYHKSWIPIPGHPFCASLRNRNAHGHVTGDFRRAILFGHLQEKCRTQIPGPAFCMEIYKKIAHGDVTKAILCSNLKEKGRTPISGHPFCSRLRSRNAHGHFARAIF